MKHCSLMHSGDTYEAKIHEYLSSSSSYLFLSLEYSYVLFWLAAREKVGLAAIPPVMLQMVGISSSLFSFIVFSVNMKGVYLISAASFGVSFWTEGAS